MGPMMGLHFSKLFLFILVALFLLPIDENLMRMGPEKTILFKNEAAAIVFMEPIGRRYLAIMEIRPRRPENFKNFLKKFKAPRAYVPVMLNEGMRVLFKGNPVPGPLPILNPRDQDPSLSFQLTFPRLKQRAMDSDICPYVWLDANRVRCLDAFLETESTIQLPMQSRGYSIVGGHIWLHALYRQRLLHRVDLKKNTIKESRLPIRSIESLLRKSGLLKRDHLCETSSGWTPTSLSANDEQKGNSPGRQAEFKRWTPSCVFRSLVHKNKLYIAFKNPPVYVVYTWPDLLPVSVYAFKKEHLPKWIHTYDDMVLEALEPFKEETVALWISFHKGITYRESKRRNPLSADIHARAWKQQHPGATLTEETILLIQSDLLLFILDHSGIRHIYDPYAAFRNEPRWKPNGLPFIMNGEVWISVRSSEPDVTRRQFKLVQLIPDA